ncbi:MAG: ribosome-associated translation inhibitor RaiA [Parcubacteria group bacterium]
MTIENSVRLYFKGLKIDDRTESYITKRLQSAQKLLEKINRIEVEIDMDKKKNKFRVEVMVKTPHQLYRAEETTESIEGSIDIVSEQLKVQIRKDKERVVALRRRGGRSLKKKITIDQNARF